MNQQVRNDGYMNMLSGLGVPGRDRTVTGAFSTGGPFRRGLSRFWSDRLSLFDLGDLYSGNGLAQKIVDRPADDCVQRGIQVVGDADEIMSAEFDRLQVLKKVADGVRWARLHGASVMLLIARDGGALDEPLNLDSLDEISEIRVFDSSIVRPTEYIYTDVNVPETFGRIMLYNFSPPGVESFYVHETRFIPISGDPIPVSQASVGLNLSWQGRSALEGCMNSLSRYSQALEWSLRLLERKQQAVYAMQGLGEMFANGDDAIVSRRINLIDLVRGNLNSVVVDKEDTYNIQNLSLDGIQAMLEEYQLALSADANMPIVVLFGKMMGGLGQTQKGGLESYYSMVSHIQEVIARPALEKLVSTLWVQRNLQGSIPDKWSIIFNPLWQPTELEVAQQEKAESERDANNINNLVLLMNQGILTPEEVRQVVVNEIYDDYGFPDTTPSEGGDINYAEGVDTSQLNVPGT